jgi:hypothetical protein
VERPGSAHHRANVAFRFTKVAVHGESHPIDATRLAYSAEPTRRDEALKAGMRPGAGAPAVGQRGARLGAGGGAAAGVGVVLATRGDDVTLPPGTVVTIRLNAPLTVRMPLN